MAMATANLEIRLSQLVEAQDSSTTAPIGHLLRAKAERSFGRDAAEAFTELREISNVPDVGEAVFKAGVTVEKLIRLVESPNGQQFQNWFHTHCRTDTVTTAREYASLLKEIAPIQKLPMKVIRFVATTILGKIPIAGEVAGAVDSFFIERWLEGASPKYFIEDLSQIAVRKPTSMEKFRQRIKKTIDYFRDRNK